MKEQLCKQIEDLTRQDLEEQLTWEPNGSACRSNNTLPWIEGDIFQKKKKRGEVGLFRFWPL